jgi:hypothetical protein
MSRAELYAEAKADATARRVQPDLDASAAEHVARYPKYPPDAFRYTSRQRRRAVQKAFADGSGWASRLVMSCSVLVHYTLNWRVLGLTEEDADPTKLRDPATVERWKAALRKTFRGQPHRLKIEAANKIHAHVLADASACPKNLRLGSACARPCESYLEAVVGYLCKPAAPYTAEHLATYWKALRKLRRQPRLSGVANIPRNLPAGELNALREYFAFQPPESDPEPTSQDTLRAFTKLDVPCLKSVPPNRPRRGRNLLRTRARAPPHHLYSGRNPCHEMRHRRRQE